MVIKKCFLYNNIKIILSKIILAIKIVSFNNSNNHNINKNNSSNSNLIIKILIFRVLNNSFKNCQLVITIIMLKKNLF